MRASKHDERRRRIAEVVMRVIARDGLDAATVRHMTAPTRSAGTCTRSMARPSYLLGRFGLLGDYARERYKEHLAREPRDLLGYLMAMTATGDEHRALWRTYVAILDRSLRDELFAEEFNSWTSAVLARIEASYRTIHPDCEDANPSARKLLALVQGISMQLLFDEQSWSEEDCRAALAKEIGAPKS